MEGIQKAMSQDFKDSIQGMMNPYGSGGAAGIIVDHLKNIPINQELIVKRFNDIEDGQ
jgi:hypothetical protein